MRPVVLCCRFFISLLACFVGLLLCSTSVVGQTNPCPCTIWPNTVTPATTDTDQTQPLELGVKFTSSMSGYITGIRFYKGVNNTGTHIGNLWSSTGTLLATATFTGESASGWQQVNFANPVAISAKTVYVASYFSPTGDFSVDRNYFATSGVNNPPLQALVDGGAGGANGVYVYSSTSQFPGSSSSFESSNYWVDVVFSIPPFTIWQSTSTPGTVDTDQTQPLELGVKFTSSMSGYITGIRFYKGVNNTGTHVGNLWSSTGTLLATATFTGETTSGWQQVNFSNPVAISANTVYVASYFSPTGDFAVDRNYFATSGVNNPPLQALVDGGAGGANGVYVYSSTSQFPGSSSSFQSSNYWVDVVFNPTNCPCTIWANTVTPATTDTDQTQPLELGVKFTSSTNGYITGIRFYKGVNNTGTHVGNLWSSTGTLLGTATFTGETASGWQQVSFANPVAISANTVYVASYFSPTGDFAVNRNYFATSGVNNPPLEALVDGGAGGANGVYVYSSTSQFPGSSSSFQSSNYWVDVAFSTTAQQSSLSITTTSLPGGTQGTAYSQTLAATGGTPPYSWALAPGSTLPAGLTLSSGGVISGTPTGSGTTSFTVQVTDPGTSTQMAQATLSITIAVEGPPPPSCPCTIWPSTSVPLRADTLGTTPVELGVKFTSSISGFITGIRFYKGASNTGTHVGNLWSSTGTLLMSATFTGETGSGWQQVNFSNPVAITANTVYVASYFSPTGDFSVSLNYFVAAVNNPPLQALVDGGAGGANGVYIYSSTSQFPSSPSSYESSNYWVDVVFNTVATGSSPAVSLSPRRGGVAVNQSLPLTATVVNDVGSAGVQWGVSSGGTLSQQTTTSAVFSAATAGVYTITATSKANGSSSATITIGVTGLTGVTTYHNNLSRDGTNTQEYTLTTANVTVSTFGKLFACPIDAPAYAQPLWVANLTINGGLHNVIYVATEHNSVYAFDADNPSCVNLWGAAVSLMPTTETYENDADAGNDAIYPDIGITGTPVIDLTTQTLYVVSTSENTSSHCTPASACHQRLHALSLINGSEKFGGPANIDATITIAGTGDGSSNGVLAFNTQRELQRPGLALVNGVVYIGWASYGDIDPFHGWLIGFNAGNLATGPVAIWNTTPNAVAGFTNSRGGIWMSGGAPAADSSNYLYLLTGNGSFNANVGGSNYGDSTVKLSTASGLSVAGYFTPEDQANLYAGDLDHGSGGAAILVNQPSGPIPHLMIGGGKEGLLFLLNRDSLGQYSSTANNVIQTVNVGNGGVFSTSAFWNNYLYIASAGGPLQQYAFNTSTGLFGTGPAYASPTSFNWPGSTPSISSTPSSTNGIVWALDTSQFGTPCCANGPAILHAYNAGSVSNELWNSTEGVGNGAGNAVKFTVPTVANGKVYVGTRSELDVYGLFP